MKKLLLSLIVVNMLLPLMSHAAVEGWQGSARPYPNDVAIVAAPDSLRPVYVSHVGRNGSRYPLSGNALRKAQKHLLKADSAGSITQSGKELLALIVDALKSGKGKWGAMTAAGFDEQRTIASRLSRRCASLFGNAARIKAMTSFSPRAMISMYTAAEQIQSEIPDIAIDMREDSLANSLLRFQDTDTAYSEYLTKGAWRELYSVYVKNNCPTTVARRLLGTKLNLSEEQQRSFALTIYQVLTGLSSLTDDAAATKWLSKQEIEALWRCENYRHYLKYSANVTSSVAIEVERTLLQEIISDADAALRGDTEYSATLRYCSGSVVMQLASLMALKGCYYLTYYDDTVDDNWHDWLISPMSANLQLTFYRAPSGTIFVGGDLNERPVTLIRGNDNLYVPWQQLRAYLLNFLL